MHCPPLFEDSSLRPSPLLAPPLVKTCRPDGWCSNSIRNGALTHKKDVKDEGRPGYVHENKWKATIGTPINPVYCTKMPRLSSDRQNSAGRFGG
jgi:hypothetical protein